MGGNSQPSQNGEVITGTYATYQGLIDLMTPQLSQDFDRSLDLLSETSVLKAKLFRSTHSQKSGQTVHALLSQKADNITFVINQQELCDNVIGVNVLKDLGFSKSASAQGS